MRVLLLILGICTGFLLLTGYLLYRYVVLRRPPSPPPNPARSKNEARRYYATHYQQQMQWLQNWGYENVCIQSGNGTPLAGYFFRARQPTNRTVLAVHGYRSNGLTEYLYFAPMYLENLGCNLLLVDDYAHGNSGGKHIGFGYPDRLDCLLWAKWLVEHVGGNSEILLQGVSMGAATVLMAAGESALPHQVKWVVADCGFTSMAAEVKHEMKRSFHLPAFPLMHIASLFCRLGAGYWFSQPSPMRSVPNIKIPVLFVHGNEDQFVPTQMGLQLHKACRASKYLLVVPSAAHAESQLVAPQQYEAAVRKLLETGHY